jgi:hypothetical protein
MLEAVLDVTFDRRVLPAALDAMVVDFWII